MKTLRIYNALLIALVCVFSSSCNNGNEKLHGEKTILLTEENMPPLTVVEGTVLETPDDALLPKYMVFRDSILVVKDEKPIDKYLLVYNLKTGELIAKYLNKGDGPNDVMYPLVQNSCHNGNLSIMDSFTKANFMMDLDSMFIQRENYRPHRITITDFVKGFCWFGDSLFVAYNGLYLEEYNDPENIPEFIKYDGRTGQRLTTDTAMNKINCSYVSGAAIYSNTDKNMIFASYNSTPRVAFFDLNFNLIKEFIGPEKYDIEHENDPDLGGLFYKGGVNNGFYGNGGCTNKYIFVCNFHVYKQEPTHKSRLEHENAMAEANDIYVFSWDGDMVARIKSKTPYFIYELTYCDDSKSLYITGKDSDGEMNLVKYDLSEIL